MVPTFASDIEVGDKSRRNAANRHVTGREHTPGYQPTFHITYSDGGETIGKCSPVAIWDPDGSVAARVMSLSAAAVR